MDDSNEGRFCKDCGTPVKGRSDKKFCDDLCRNAFHNRHKTEDHAYINAVNRVLKRNRAIMRAFFEGGTKKVTAAGLAAKGFDFDLYTSVEETFKGVRRYYCYEYGYYVNSSVLVLLRRKMHGN
jgi:hypothetical protein